MWCPHCNKQINLMIKICKTRKISRINSKTIKQISKKPHLRKYNSLTDVEDWIDKLESNYKFKVSEIRDRFGWTNKTEGDLLRKLLDYYVCKGILSKIPEFGSKGHTYIKNENNIFVCPMVNQDKKGFLFCNNKWKDENYFELMKKEYTEKE